MKIALINDTHFGARSDSQIFANYFFRFFEEQFFPYLKENDITHVLHLGDLVDRRKFINFNTLNMTRKRFLEPLNDMGVKMHIILGNHDTYYKNTNDLNSIRELFGDRYENITIVEQPMELMFDDVCIGLVPWINKENEIDCSSFIENTAATIVAGHFELNGYEVIPGLKHQGGMSDTTLKRFEQVWSGHFHQKSGKNNVHYLGTQYQITFSDLHIKKGFHVFDTETRALEFIENPERMFHAINYDDTDPNVITDSLEKDDFTKFKNGQVKIFVHMKKSPYLFDRFMDKLYDAQVNTVTIVEDLTQDDIDEEEVVDMSKDTLTLIMNEIDSMDEVTDKGKLKSIIRELYMESLSL